LRSLQELPPLEEIAKSLELAAPTAGPTPEGGEAELAPPPIASAA
jgi:hypothetical protein